MVKVIAVVVLLLTSGFSIAQDRSLGLRLGYPLGISYKSYIQSNRAVEFLIGTSPSGWNGRYYEKSFGKYRDFDQYNYLSHHVRGTFYLQGRYLFQYNIPVDGMEGKLDWYWGAGALFKFANVEYQYQSRDPVSASYFETVTDIDFGPEFMGGVEYTFEDVPITLFGELSMMMELANRPLVFRAFWGTGARLRF